PGCTIEPFAISPGHLHHLRSLPPADFPELLLRNLDQLLVNGHEVVGFSAGLGEAFFKELVKRGQVLEPPVLSCPHLAEVLSQLDKAHIPLLFFSPFPSEDLVNLVQDQQSAPSVEICLHRCSVSPQARQANQGRSLRAYESGSFQRVAGYQGTDPNEGSSHSRYWGIGFRCAKRNAPIPTDGPLSQPSGRIPCTALLRWWP